jgi:hypothetical protein
MALEMGSNHIGLIDQGEGMRIYEVQSRELLITWG